MSAPVRGGRADVSVVVVNYNARAMLLRTLDSIVSSRPRSALEVIVVDNASADGSVAAVRAAHPDVRCLALPGNRGLACANNAGMRAATGRYVFLLNNDTIVRPGAIDVLAAYLEANPRVGAAGSKVLNPDGTLQGTVKGFPSPAAALFGRNSPLTRLWPRNPISRRYLVYLDRPFDVPFAAEAVSCCALMVRREALERAGPMDERYFVYWSDVDWCRELWRAGFEVHCVPDSVVVHDEHKGGSRARSPRVLPVLDFHRGAYLYYRKWHVRRPWHPNHAAAIVGLAARAAIVLAKEQLAWAASGLRRSA